MRLIDEREVKVWGGLSDRLGIVTNFIVLYVLIKKLLCYFETNTLKYAELVVVLAGNAMPVCVELTVAKVERVEGVDVVRKTRKSGWAVCLISSKVPGVSEKPTKQIEGKHLNQSIWYLWKDANVCIEFARTDVEAPEGGSLLVKQTIWALHRRSECSAGQPL